MRRGWSKPKKWKRKDESYLRRYYAALPLDRIARKLRRTSTSVKARASKLKLSKGRRYFTAVENVQIRREYPSGDTAELARSLGRSHISVQSHAINKLGLRKTPEFMRRLLQHTGRSCARLGLGNRFPKGHVPANKGLRRPGYAPGRMKKTQFKKGQRPRNYLPIGTIQANADGYLRVKVADDRPGKGANSLNWEFLHKRVWEAAHGPIPAGHRIWWKDRNHENCALENLELLSDREHMARTTIHNLPPDLKQTIQILGAMRRRIGRMQRAQKQAVGPAQPSV